MAFGLIRLLFNSPELRTSTMYFQAKVSSTLVSKLDIQDNIELPRHRYTHFRCKSIGINKDTYVYLQQNTHFWIVVE